jgi:DNA-binding CsgD family transcriptional regulator
MKGSEMSGFDTSIQPRSITDERGHHDFQTLSPRELDVLQALVDGRGSVEGAASLYISRHTFRTHVKSIYRKTGTHSAIEAVSLGVSLGMRPSRLAAA